MESTPEGEIMAPKKLLVTGATGATGFELRSAKTVRHFPPSSPGVPAREGREDECEKTVYLFPLSVRSFDSFNELVEEKVRSVIALGIRPKQVQHRQTTLG